MKILGLSLAASFLLLAGCHTERTHEEANPQAAPSKPLHVDEPIATKPLSDETVFDRTVSEKTVADRAAHGEDTKGHLPGELAISGDPATAAQPKATPAKLKTYGTAELKGEKTDGKATFSGTEAGLTKVSVDLKSAPEGTYEVHVIDGAHCGSLANLENKKSKWKNLGEVTLDKEGNGQLEVATEAGDSKLLNRRTVVISEDDDAIACGTVSVENAG